jgi:rhodanese-related sulfurtransferase
VALLLRKRGITRIHPLAGGIDAWLANKFPLERPGAVKENALV